MNENNDKQRANSADLNRDTLISAEENRRMFDDISGHYDFMNSVISLGLHTIWRNKAVKILDPAPGGCYLDIGCGTGDISIAIVKKQGKARVTGIDVSQKMIEAGNKKIAGAGFTEMITLQSGDAVSLAYGNGTFDGIITGFCIRNVEDRQKALREMYRVLKPGAGMVILELTVPASGILSAGYRFYTGTIIPLAALIIMKGKAYKYLRESIREFPSPDLFRDQIISAGFQNTGSIPLTFGAVTIFTGKKPL